MRVHIYNTVHMHSTTFYFTALHICNCLVLQIGERVLVTKSKLLVPLVQGKGGWFEEVLYI